MSNIVTNYYKNKEDLNISVILYQFLRKPLDIHFIFVYNSRPQTLRDLEKETFRFEFEIIEN
jgi:hypothetical protein